MSSSSPSSVDINTKIKRKSLMKINPTPKGSSLVRKEESQGNNIRKQPTATKTMKKSNDPTPLEQQNIKQVEKGGVLSSSQQPKFISLMGGVQFPLELMIRVGEYLQVVQLNVMAQCNSLLLELFFNMERKSLMEPNAGRSVKRDESCEFETVQQLIWKSLVFSYFPKFSNSIKIKNWMYLLRRRLKHVKLYKSTTKEENLFKLDLPSFAQSKHDEMIIENCEWIYKCPLSFENLEVNGSSSVRFCSVCRKNVFQVDSMNSFMSNIKLGNCVAFSSEKINVSDVSPQMIRSMGSCIPPPRFKKKLNFPIKK